MPLPVTSSPAFSGFILRGGLAAFVLLTRPNRVYCVTAHVFAARVLASSITGTHARFGYMLNRQLHGELLSVHKINQAYPGTPRQRAVLVVAMQFCITRSFLARRDYFLVGLAVRLSPPAVAGVSLRLSCFVGQPILAAAGF